MVGGSKPGGAASRLAYFENVGTPKLPKFVVRDGAVLGDDGLTGAVRPDCGDVNGDGWADVVAGIQDGGVFSFLNTGSSGAGARLLAPEAIETEAKISHDGPIALYDMDGDGDLDIVLAMYGGRFSMLRRDGQGYVFDADPWPGLVVQPNASPAIRDMNGDGLPDWIVGNFQGQLCYFASSAAPGAGK